MLKMEKKELHKFAATREKGLPERKNRSMKHYGRSMKYHGG